MNAPCVLIIILILSVNTILAISDSINVFNILTYNSNYYFSFPLFYSSKKSISYIFYCFISLSLLTVIPCNKYDVGVKNILIGENYC